jgi:Dr1-associated corepressor
MSNNEEYAPQSPDLSDYAPQSPDFSGYAPPPPGPQIDTSYPYSTHRASYDASPYFATPSQQLPPSVLPTVAEQFPTMARAKRSQREEVDEYTPESEEATFSSRSRKAKRGGQDGSRTSAASEIEVKTKFHVARIKRIMQADEEVGKVAQVTPIAVCKSSQCPYSRS